MLNAKTCSRLKSDLMLNKAVIPIPREQSKRGNETDISFKLCVLRLLSIKIILSNFTIKGDYTVFKKIQTIFSSSIFNDIFSS